MAQPTAQATPEVPPEIVQPTAQATPEVTPEIVQPAPAQVPISNTPLTPLTPEPLQPLSEEEARVVENIKKGKALDYTYEDMDTVLNRGKSVDDVQLSSEKIYERYLIDSIAPATGEVAPTQSAGESVPMDISDDMAKKSDIEQKERTKDAYQDYAAEVINIESRFSQVLTSLGGVVSDNLAKKSAEISTNIQIKVEKSFADRGIKARYNTNHELFVIDPVTKEELQVTPDFIDTLQAAKWEVILPVGAAMILGAPIEVPTALIATGLGMAASVVGNLMDYVGNAEKTNQKIKVSTIADKVIDTASADLFIGGAIAGLGAAVVGTKSLVPTRVKQTFNVLADGNTQGAVKAMQDKLHLSDTQIEEQVKIFSNTYKVYEDLSKNELTGLAILEKWSKELGVVPHNTNNTGVILANEKFNILNNHIKELGNNVPLKDNLQNLATQVNSAKSDIKTYINTVRAVGTEAMSSVEHKVDFSSLVPTHLKTWHSMDIASPGIKNISDYVKKLQDEAGEYIGYNKSDVGSTIVIPNDIKNTPGEVPSKVGYKVLNHIETSLKNTLKGNLDYNTRNVLKEIIENVQKTKDDTLVKYLDKDTSARLVSDRVSSDKAYAQLMNEESNGKVLKELLKRDAVAPHFANEITNLIDSISPDNSSYTSFTNFAISNAIGKEAVETLESTVLDKMLKKYTTSTHGNRYNLVDFTQLHTDLKGIKFKSAQARRFVKLASQYEKVSGTDTAKISAKFVGNPETSISTSFEGILKRIAVNKYFNYARQFVSSKDVMDVRAMNFLLNKVARNPLDLKSQTTLLKGVKNNKLKGELNELFKDKAVTYMKLLKTNFPDSSIDEAIAQMDIYLEQVKNQPNSIFKNISEKGERDALTKIKGSLNYKKAFDSKPIKKDNILNTETSIQTKKEVPRKQKVERTASQKAMAKELKKGIINIGINKVNRGEI